MVLTVTGWFAQRVIRAQDDSRNCCFLAHDSHNACGWFAQWMIRTNCNLLLATQLGLSITARRYLAFKWSLGCTTPSWDRVIISDSQRHVFSFVVYSTLFLTDYLHGLHSLLAKFGVAWSHVCSRNLEIPGSRWFAQTPCANHLEPSFSSGWFAQTSWMVRTIVRNRFARIIWKAKWVKFALFQVGINYCVYSISFFSVVTDL